MSAHTERYTPVDFSGLATYLVIVAMIACTAVALCGLYGVGREYSHGAEKHGSATDSRINDCLDKNGAVMVMWNHLTDNWIEICELEDGVFGVRPATIIKGKFEALTGYIERGVDLYEVENRLLNLGYAVMLEATR